MSFTNADKSSMNRGSIPVLQILSSSLEQYSLFMPVISTDEYLIAFFCHTSGRRKTLAAAGIFYSCPGLTASRKHKYTVTSSREKL